MVQVLATLGEFEKTIADAGDKLVVVDFTASWCPPCQKIKPKFHELADARNLADNMIHATEKSLKDLGEDKVSVEEKQAIDKAIYELKETLKADHKAAIQEKTAALAELSGKLAE